MYVWHNFIDGLISKGEVVATSGPFPPRARPAHFAQSWLSPLQWAAASWHLFEKPLNKLKSRFPYVVNREGQCQSENTGKDVERKEPEPLCLIAS